MAADHILYILLYTSYMLGYIHYTDPQYPSQYTRKKNISVDLVNIHHSLYIMFLSVVRGS